MCTRLECWTSRGEASLGSLHIYGAQQLFIVLVLIPSTIALMIATKLELKGIVDFQLVHNYKWVQQKSYAISIEVKSTPHICQNYHNRWLCEKMKEKNAKCKIFQIECKKLFYMV